MCVAVPDSPQRSRRAEGSAWRGRALADSQCVWVARPKGRLTSFTGMEPKGFMSTFVGTVEFVPPRVAHRRLAGGVFRLRSLHTVLRTHFPCYRCSLLLLLCLRAICGPSLKS